MAKSELTRPTDATIKRLFARSGNHCAFPKCTVEIVQGDTLVGEMCHIKAARPGGPRYDPHQSAADRHGYNNLILLCGTHHTVIDHDEEAYTVERLIKMKTGHEQRAMPLTDDNTASGTQLLIDQSVRAKSQSGGITAHTVNIYAGQLSTPSDRSRTSRPAPFPKAEPKDGPARFRAPGEPVGIRWDLMRFARGANNSILFAAGPALWLRLMPPLDPGRTWTSSELRQAMQGGLGLQPFIWSNVFTLRAEDGIGCCALHSADERETNSVAFAFETGEIWAIDTWLLGVHPAELLAVEIEKMFTERLPEYGRFLMRLGLQPPYQWIAGLTDTKNRRLQFPPPQGQMRTPTWPGHECLSEHIIKPGTYDGKQSPTSALLPFFKEIYHKCGMPRPDYLPQ